MPRGHSQRYNCHANCMTWPINLGLTTSIYLGYIQYGCCLEMRGQFMADFGVPPLARHLFITRSQVKHFSAFMHGLEEDLKF